MVNWDVPVFNEEDKMVIRDDDMYNHYIFPINKRNVPINHFTVLNNHNNVPEVKCDVLKGLGTCYELTIASSSFTTGTSKLTTSSSLITTITSLTLYVVLSGLARD